MTRAATATAGVIDGGRSAAVPRAERRRRQRERRAVIATGLAVLSALVGVVAMVLGHFAQGRGPAPQGMMHITTQEARVSDTTA